MDQDPVDQPAHHGHGLGDALGLALGHQNVAQRDGGGQAPRLGGLEQRQQLEGELAPAEGKHLDQDQIRVLDLEGGEQQSPAPVAPDIVDRPPVLVEDRGEMHIGRHRGRQLDQLARPDVDLARRRPAGDEPQVEARRLDRPGDEGGAAQMADAQEMLDVEQDHGSQALFSSGRLSCRSEGVPSSARA